MKDGKYLAEYNLKNELFWYSTDNIWSVFKSKYDLEDNEINNLIKHQVEKHFKIDPVTPIFSSVLNSRKWNNQRGRL